MIHQDREISSYSYKLVPVEVRYLEMHSIPSSRLEWPEKTDAVLFQKPITASEYRRLYYGVGEPWNWLDRMVMTDAELEEKVNAANTEIWVIQVDGKEAGFAEFVKESNYTEIQYFGLFPSFVGRGLGKFFLNWTIQKAWSFDPKWIQLNTCALDHPNALSVYQKAGFNLVRKEIQERKVLIR